MTTIPKCQAKNPALCVDPQCPEKQFHREVSRNALNTYMGALRVSDSATTAEELFAARADVIVARDNYFSTREGIQSLEEAYADSDDEFEKAKLAADLVKAKESFAARFGGNVVAEVESGPLIPEGEHSYDVPTFKRDEDSNDYYPATTGSKFGGHRPITEIAKDIRGDLKEAQAKGYLPKHLKFSVTVDKGSWTSSVQVEVQGGTDEQIYSPEKDTWGHAKFSEDAKELKKRVEGIAAAYNQSRTNSQVDYFQETYYSRVVLEDAHAAKYRAKEAAEAKAKRETIKKVNSLKSSFKSTPAEKWLASADVIEVGSNKDGTKISKVPNSELIVVEYASGAKLFEIPKNRRRSRVDHWASRLTNISNNEMYILDQYEVN